MNVSNLNRRHKTVLLLTLAAAGVSLILESSAKQSVGIILLGLAFAWVLGSNSRAVHWLLVVSGFTLLLAPCAYNWYDYQGAVKSYETKITAFEQRTPELAKQYQYKKTATDPHTGARSGWNGAMWIVIAEGNSTHGVGDEWDGERWISEPNTPKWMTKALREGIDVDAVPEYQKPSYFPPESFSVWRSLVAGWMIELAGLILLGVGFGMILRFK